MIPPRGYDPGTCHRPLPCGNADGRGAPPGGYGRGEGVQKDPFICRPEEYILQRDVFLIAILSSAEVSPVLIAHFFADRGDFFKGTRHPSSTQKPCIIINIRLFIF